MRAILVEPPAASRHLPGFGPVCFGRLSWRLVLLHALPKQGTHLASDTQSAKQTQPVRPSHHQPCSNSPLRVPDAKHEPVANGKRLEFLELGSQLVLWDYLPLNQMRLSEFVRCERRGGSENLHRINPYRSRKSDIPQIVTRGPASLRPATATKHFTIPMTI